MSLSPARVLIVDDEPFAREKIRGFLAEEADFYVIGECGNGEEALRAMQTQQPEVVFLDIQMPRMNGFEVLQQLDTARLPTIVFVTAFDEFALNAFETHALDYLLKPFDFERFQKTLARLREHLKLRQAAELNSKLEQLLQQLHSGPAYLQRLMIKSRGDIYFVKTADIDWIEAAGNYITLHTGKKTHLLRDSISNMQRKLDPARFARIHRSQIVNVDRIRKLNSDLHGDYFITMQDGTSLILSRTYRDNLLRHFEQRR